MAQYVFRNADARLDQDNRVKVTGDLVFIADDATETVAIAGWEAVVPLSNVTAMANQVEQRLREDARLDWFHVRNDTLTDLETDLSAWTFDPEAGP